MWAIGLVYFFLVAAAIAAIAIVFVRAFRASKRTTHISTSLAPTVDESHIAEVLARARASAERFGDYQAAVMDYIGVIAEKPDVVEPRLHLAKAFILSNWYDNWEDTLLLLDESEPYFRDERRMLIAAYLRAFVLLLLGRSDEAAEAQKRMTELIKAGARADDWDVGEFEALLSRSEFIRGSVWQHEALNAQWRAAHGP